MKKCFPQHHLRAGRWSNITSIHIPCLEDILQVQEWRNPSRNIVHLPTKQGANSLIHIFLVFSAAKQDLNISLPGHKSKSVIQINQNRTYSITIKVSFADDMVPSSLRVIFLCSCSCPHHHSFRTTKFHSKRIPIPMQTVSRAKSANAIPAKHCVCIGKKLLQTSDGEGLKCWKIQTARHQNSPRAAGGAEEQGGWPGLFPGTSPHPSTSFPLCMHQHRWGAWSGAAHASIAQLVAANLMALPTCLLLSRDPSIWWMTFEKKWKEKLKINPSVSLCPFYQPARKWAPSHPSTGGREKTA